MSTEETEVVKSLPLKALRARGNYLLIKEFHDNYIKEIRASGLVLPNYLAPKLLKKINPEEYGVTAFTGVVVMVEQKKTTKLFRWLQKWLPFMYKAENRGCPEWVVPGLIVMTWRPQNHSKIFVQGEEFFVIGWQDILLSADPKDVVEVEIDKESSDRIKAEIENPGDGAPIAGKSFKNQVKDGDIFFNQPNTTITN
jgi:hypothetical protein